MKILFHKFSIYHVIIAAMTLLVAISCSTDEPNVPDPPGTQPETTGDISYTYSNDGSGIGSLSSPAVCHGTDPLHFTISQTSTYADLDGSKFTCDPKATVTIQASQDTLYVKNLQDLVTVNASPDAQRTTSGNNPVAHRAVQTFDVGGQIITFDMMHEVYTHVNKEGMTIEMPYFKLNDMKYGAAQTIETSDPHFAAPAVANMSVRGIRLTPRPMTGPHRAKSVTMVQAYDVTVSFNMDIETVNAKKPQSHTLSFEVTYAAEVESTTQVPDPTTTLSYQTVVKQGSYSEASPFEVTPGETMHLQLLGTSQCSYFSMEALESRVITRETTANVIVALGRDTVTYSDDPTVSIEDWDVETSGTDPVNHTCRQIITLGGGQAIVTDWDYQSLGDLQVNDETVAMPWLQLEKPTVHRVTVSENDGKAEVTVRLRQNIKLMNLAEPRTETMEYIVRYIAVKEEPKLVKVTYRKDWEWELVYRPEYDDWHWGCGRIIYREKTFSDGKTYTDTFRDYLRMDHDIEVDPSSRPYGTVSWDGGKIIFYPSNYKPYHLGTYLDSVSIATASIAVPDIEHVRSLESYHVEELYLGDWGKYQNDRHYIGFDLDLSGVTIDGQGLPSDLESGWYGGSFMISHIPFELIYDPGFYIDGNHTARVSVGLYFADGFFVIDGQMFTFNEFIDPPRFKDSVVDFPGDATRGPGKIYKSEVRQRYMGVNFYGAAIDTVFTFK